MAAVNDLNRDQWAWRVAGRWPEERHPCHSTDLLKTTVILDAA